MMLKERLRNHIHTCIVQGKCSLVSDQCRESAKNMCVVKAYMNDSIVLVSSDCKQNIKSSFQMECYEK